MVACRLTFSVHSPLYPTYPWPFPSGTAFPCKRRACKWIVWDTCVMYGQTYSYVCIQWKRDTHESWGTPHRSWWCYEGSSPQFPSYTTLVIAHFGSVYNKVIEQTTRSNQTPLFLYRSLVDFVPSIRDINQKISLKSFDIDMDFKITSNNLILIKIGSDWQTRKIFYFIKGRPIFNKESVVQFDQLGVAKGVAATFTRKRRPFFPFRRFLSDEGAKTMTVSKPRIRTIPWMTANLTITMSHGLYLLIALSILFFLSLSWKEENNFIDAYLRYPFISSSHFEPPPSS